MRSRRILSAAACWRADLILTLMLERRQSVEITILFIYLVITSNWGGVRQDGGLPTAGEPIGITTPGAMAASSHADSSRGAVQRPEQHPFDLTRTAAGPRYQHTRVHGRRLLWPLLFVWLVMVVNITLCGRGCVRASYIHGHASLAMPLAKGNCPRGSPTAATHPIGLVLACHIECG